MGFDAVGAYFHATFIHITATCISNDTSNKYATINNSCSCDCCWICAFFAKGACTHTRSLTHSLIQNHKHINNALAARQTVFSRSFGRLINKNLCPCLNIYFYAKMYANESYFRIFGGGNGNGDGGKIGVIIRECIKACAAICQH